MRILSGCFSLLAMLFFVCMFMGVFSEKQAARGGSFATPPNGYTPPRPGYYYDAPFGGLAHDFVQGIRVLTGWTVGIILIVCVGIPAAFVMLGLALFFFSSYQRERHHREMMDAQFARNRIIDYHTSQNH